MSGNPLVHWGRLCIRLAFRVSGFDLHRRRVFVLGVGFGTAICDLHRLMKYIEFHCV